MAANEAAPRRRRARRRRHPVLRAIGYAVVAVVVFLAATTAGLLAAPVDFTPPSPPRPVLLMDRNNKLIGEIAGPEERVEVPAAQIPTVMRNAIVAAEDKSFYSNSGVDPLAIVRAGINDVRGGASQGGSTITQQYVKNVFVGNEHSLGRKIKEAALALRLDQRLSKQEILTRYLNVVYFGNKTYGVQAAARYYFGVDASKLTLAQASLLAGIVPAPSDYNPVRSLTLARQRQLYVLNRMVDSGYITSAAASAAYAHVPRIVARPAAAQISSAVAPQFVADVTADINARYKSQPDLLNKGGLGVRTTLDLNWQKSVNAAIASVLPDASDPEAAVIVLDTRDGSILAQASRNTAADRFADLARTLDRVSGSSVKPFTLATALENGDTLDTREYAPATRSYPVSQCGLVDGKPYTITNDEGGGGSYTLSSALALSVNTVYGPLAIDVGRSKVAATAQAAGLISAAEARSAAQNCSMGLGVNTSPLQEAVAYSTLANSGIHHDARQLLSVNQDVDATGAGGTTIYRQPVSKAVQAIPSDVAGQVQDAMRGVVRYGTATRAQQPDGLDVFGKTGTTDDFVDAWFTGCIPAYHVCMSTWMGYKDPGSPADPHTLKNVEGFYHVAGGTLPAKIFAQTMDDYRAAAHPVVTPTSSAVPAPTTRFLPVSPTGVTRRRSSAPAAAPTPTRSRSTAPTPTRTSARATPTPTPTGSGLPVP